MLKGGFVFLGQDIFINITLIDVETGTTRTFSERGYQENTVHSLAEELLKHMTGRDFSLTGSRGDRSILAMEQQEPGTVELFSMIIDARVYIDEEFAGYTTGDSTVPLVLTVPPGRHSIRVHLSKDFGVIDTPEVTFRDWEEEFHLMPGEKIILEDRTRHFNDRLYRMVQVLRESARIVPGSEEVRQVIHSAGFTDREGEDVEISLSLLWEETATPAKGGRAVITLIYQGESYNFDYFSPAGKDSEFKEEIGKIRFEADLECRSDFYWDLDYSIRRTDIRQGMHRE